MTGNVTPSGAPGRRRGRNRRAQRGGARLKAIIWTVILAAFVYTCYKIIPIYFANYQLEDDLRQEALYSLGKYNDDAMRVRVFNIMQKDKVAADKDSIHILQNDARGLKILVDYTVPVDLMVYQLNLHFAPSTDNQSLVQ